MTRMMEPVNRCFRCLLVLPSKPRRRVESYHRCTKVSIYKRLSPQGITHSRISSSPTIQIFINVPILYTSETESELFSQACEPVELRILDARTMSNVR